MSDDLNDLKAAMKSATPPPDEAKKAAHLMLAQKNFEEFQGSRSGARPSSNRPGSGLWTGVRNMLNAMTSRGGLVASTAIVAVGFVMLSPLGEGMMRTGTLEGFGKQEQAVEPVQAVTKAIENRPPKADLADRMPALATPTAESEGLFLGGTLQPERLHRKSPAQAGLRRTVNAPSPSEQAGDGIGRQPTIDTETFSNQGANPLKVVTEEPVSTFSIDVDTASYSVVRNSLTNGVLPPKDAVRVEEMINYFPYDYVVPATGEVFRPTVSVSQTPWNTDTQLVHIGIQGALPDLDDRPPLNLVFLIDTSGSMNQPKKLPLLKQALTLMLGQLRPQDQVAIVAYAGSAGQVLAPTPAGERATILEALKRLGAGGSTAGQAGLQQAYAVAEGMAEDGEVNRVILATDGDFNVGLSDPDVLKDFIAGKRETGTYLSVLGFGRGNLDDATMQALAQNGNGIAAYIDTLSEAQKVLVDQLSGALFPIADDVKIQVEFNPAEIAEYRLIGYETRTLRREDFNNDKVDAGDIGAGHSVTALYEVTPVGSPAQLTESLRYQPATDAVSVGGELAFLRLRYKAPGASDSTLIEMPITADLPARGDTGFAVAVAGFGQLLRGSTYLGDWSWGDAIALANANKGNDPFGYRTEAVQLMRLGESLSAQ